MTMRIALLVVAAAAAACSGDVGMHPGPHEATGAEAGHEAQGGTAGESIGTAGGAVQSPTGGQSSGAGGTAGVPGDPVAGAPLARDGGGEAAMDARATDSSAAAPGVAIFVRTDANLRVDTSCDGATWRRAALPAPAAGSGGEADVMRTATYVAGRIWALGGGTTSNGGYQRVYSTVDGVAWTAHRTAGGDWIAGIGYVEAPSGGVLVIGGGNRSRWYSKDGGGTWTTGRPVCTTRRMASGGNRVVAVCDEGLAIGKLNTGTGDPLAWTVAQGAGDGTGQIAYGNGRFVVVHGNSLGCKVLADGSDAWAACGRGGATGVVFADGWFYVVDGSGPRWSEDGTTWVDRPALTARGSGVLAAYGDDKLVRTNAYGLTAGRVAACR